MERYPNRSTLAKAYGLMPAEEVVFDSIDLPNKKQRELTINFATEFAITAKPPFEWKMELFFPETVQHYLWLANGRFVRAERKEFFAVTKEELSYIGSALTKYLN